MSDQESFLLNGFQRSWNCSGPCRRQYFDHWLENIDQTLSRTSNTIYAAIIRDIEPNIKTSLKHHNITQSSNGISKGSIIIFHQVTFIQYQYPTNIIIEQFHFIIYTLVCSSWGITANDKCRSEIEPFSHNLLNGIKV